MPNDDQESAAHGDTAIDLAIAMDTSPDNAAPIVAIGASAGGIEALGLFFDAMSGNSGAAFVVVLHLDPTKASQLQPILARHTMMPVLDITDGMTIAANHVYVIAPNASLTVDGNLLRLTEPTQPRGLRHPVDVLFKSLADERQERTVAIILSGMGTNGTQGLREVKAAGGLILVQDPMSARFDGMPRSAISAGLADHIQEPGDMPQTLLRYLRHGYVNAPSAAVEAALVARSVMTQLIDLVRVQAGLDFRSYKAATIARRISRRMSLRNLDDLPAYVAVLDREPGEVRALSRDLLINVTSFFRDAEAWAAFDELVVTPLVANRASGADIRVWVPACATGEEAYTLAMMLTERAEAAGKHFRLKIFASDILDDNLNVARSGIYPGSSVEILAPERVTRFFKKVDAFYQVTERLRELIVFARQDILREPPFSRMDLITCRNMLIYIEPDAQRRALSLFHFALREGGTLFIGNAETLGRAENLFDAVSKKHRIYRRAGPPRRSVLEFPLLGSRGTAGDAPVTVAEAPPRVMELARRALLERYAPAAVLVDHHGQVLYFHGPTTDYLQQPGGAPTRSLLAMARDGLASKLRVALREVAGNTRDSGFEVDLRLDGTSYTVTVTVFRLPLSTQASGLVIVTFDRKSAREPERQTTMPRPEARIPQSALEAELRSTQADLQSAVEQLEDANEELKALNEEATSMNEELRSVNEELGTSKEELQSFNEELHTVNNQLQFKVRELETVRDDSSNLLSGTGIATIFLDSRMSIKWFSPAIEQVLDLQLSDIGRPLSHFARKFADDALLTDAEAVLATMAPREGEVRGDDGRWFLRRMLPYRTRDDRVAGLIITFTDVTERRNATDSVDEARIYSEAIVATTRQAFLVLDAGMQIQSANAAFYTMFTTAPASTLGRHIYDLGVDQNWDTVELRVLLEGVLPRNEQFQNVEIAFGHKDGGSRTMVLNGCRLLRGDGRDSLILLAIEESTERKRVEAALIQSEKEFRTLGEEQPNLCWMAHANGSIYWYNRRWYEYTGAVPTDMQGWGWQSVHDPAVLPKVLDRWKAAIVAGTPFEMTFPLRGADGVFRPFLTRVAPVRDEAGQIIRWFGSNVDISQQRATEDALRQSKEALRHLNETLERRVQEAVVAREQTQARLAQAQRMEALGQLAGGIAHDFNNVLQVLTSALSLIERRANDSGSVRDIARMGGDAARRGTSVTGRLLAFARKGELQASAVPCVPLLENLREILVSTLDPNITIRVEIAPDVAPLLADKAQLETVLINLAINSRDAMPKGGALTLTAAVDPVGDDEAHPAGLDPGRYMRLGLADTGIGMDEATLARVSEPFFTTKPVGQGTGLGVAMARGFAEQSGGGFAIRSQQGRGTTVSLWFPQADGPPTEQPRAPAVPTCRVDANVMVVDDDEAVREMIGLQLSEVGYRIVSASDGLVALARLDAGEGVDVLVTDLSMPGMNGLALIEEVRKRRPGLPALLLTGYADAGQTLDMEGAQGEGTVFLQKPVLPQQLVECVARLRRAHEDGVADPRP